MTANQSSVTPDLFDYHLCQPGLLVVPIEALSPDGMAPAFAKALLDRDALEVDAIDLFNDAFAAYWAHADRLHREAPRYWFPPRVQHVCVATEPHRIRPYFQPFNRSSWLIYASDLDPDTSSVEFAAYQLLHAERMGLLGQIVPTLLANLSYVLTLDDDQLENLAAGCHASSRPDAAGFVALADALPWVRQLYHVSLKRPQVALPGATQMPRTGLIVPDGLREGLGTLEAAWAEAAQATVKRHRDYHATPSPAGGQRIRDWLAETAPPLLVTGEEWRILWAPDEPEQTDALETALDGITALAEESILQDLRTVGHHSRRFLDSLQAPDELVDPAPYITEGGLSYIHKTRKLVAYHIGPGENAGRLWQSTPPYERWMLAARTVHEWGHLAAESGWVRVPASRQAEREALEASFVEQMEAVHADAPPRLREITAEEVARLREKHGRLGEALLHSMLGRIEDYMSNLLAARFLSADEMDTYVRNNVFAHVDAYDPQAVYQELTRCAYEVQYLGLSRVPTPLEWFVKSTWFVERFVRNGVVTMARFEQLVETVGSMCGCYELDASAFDFTLLDKSEGLQAQRDLHD